MLTDTKIHCFLSSSYFKKSQVFFPKHNTFQIAICNKYTWNIFQIYYGFYTIPKLKPLTHRKSASNSESHFSVLRKTQWESLLRNQKHLLILKIPDTIAMSWDTVKVSSQFFLMWSMLGSQWKYYRSMFWMST